MSKTVLIAAIVGCFLVVGVIGGVTAAVIDTDSGGTRVVRLQSGYAPGPGPLMPGPGRGFRRFGPGQAPQPRQQLPQFPGRGTPPSVR